MVSSSKLHNNLLSLALCHTHLLTSRGKTWIKQWFWTSQSSLLQALGVLGEEREEKLGGNYAPSKEAEEREPGDKVRLFGAAEHRDSCH